jgi:hypothetical protein
MLQHVLEFFPTFSGASSWRPVASRRRCTDAWDMAATAHTLARRCGRTPAQRRMGRLRRRSMAAGRVERHAGQSTEVVVVGRKGGLS